MGTTTVYRCMEARHGGMERWGVSASEDGAAWATQSTAPSLLLLLFCASGTNMACSNPTTRPLKVHVLLDGAHQGTLGNRANDGHDAFTVTEEHQRGDVSDLELGNGLRVLVRTELQYLQLAAVLIDNFVHHGPHHATWATPASQRTSHVTCRHRRQRRGLLRTA